MLLMGVMFINPLFLHWYLFGSWWIRKYHMLSTPYYFSRSQYLHPSYCVSFIFYICIALISDFATKWHYEHSWGSVEVGENSQGYGYWFILNGHILIPVKHLYGYSFEMNETSSTQLLISTQFCFSHLQWF